MRKPLGNDQIVNKIFGCAVLLQPLEGSKTQLLYLHVEKSPVLDSHLSKIPLKLQLMQNSNYINTIQ